MEENVEYKTYFFDCWKKDGVLDTIEIEAACEEHARLKFEREYPDHAYDDPYW